MNNLSITLESTGTLSNLYKSVDDALEGKPTALTLLVAAGNDYSKELLDPLLMGLKIPVSGGVFPQIIHTDKILSKGTIIIGWDKPVSITNYKNIENTESIKDLVGSMPNKKSDVLRGKHLIFIDGSVSKIEENLDALYKKKGFQVTYAGSVVGSAIDSSNPCIISNDGLLRNTMQTVAISYNAKTTVTHGWKKQSGPHLVTSSDRTIVHSINFEPISALYKKHNKAEGSNDEDMSKFISSYPLGIENLDGDLLLRYPLRTTEDSIEYIGNIPEYSKVHILSGTHESARDEVDNELYSLKLRDEKNVEATFIFSCVLRDDKMQNGESKEIKMLNQHLGHSKHIIGALTLGEIATSQHKLLQLHSKSIVITRLAGDA